MNRLTRRDTLLASAGTLAGATLLHAGRALADVPAADVPAPKFDVEKGAALKVLRPSKFVEGDERLFAENTKKFIAQYGVQVDSRQRELGGSAAQDGGRGEHRQRPRHRPRLVGRPAQVPAKCLDLTDLAEYLGPEVRRLVSDRRAYGKASGRQVDRHAGRRLGGRIVYRKSWVNEAGFESMPKDLDGFLKLCQALKKNGHPIGLALGNARGRRQRLVHWLMWTFGGSVVDQNDQVTINSKETIEALKYGKALAETFIPGVTLLARPVATTRRSSPAKSA